MKSTTTGLTAIWLVLILMLAACGSGGSEESDADSGGDDAAEEGSTEQEEPAEEPSEEEEPAGEGMTEEAVTEDTEAAVDLAAEAGVERIAFFGFWSTNSFTLSILDGVQTAADEYGIEVVDLSTPEFDATGQIQAMQDQNVAGDAQMYITLASDSVGLATAAEEAIAEGITVVAAFTPLGPDFTTLEPQIDGLVIVAETPVDNGTTLAELAIGACEDTNPCQVAYLEGLAALPLDNARTEAFNARIDAEDGVEVVAQVEGGYSPDTGQAAAQDVMQSNPDINVMVGSSQAIVGAQEVVDTSQVGLVGNGSSTEAFEGVRSGEWYALYNSDIFGIGSTSVEQGLRAAAGEDVDPVNIQELRNPLGTVENIEEFEPAYSDLG